MDVAGKLTPYWPYSVYVVSRSETHGGFVDVNSVPSPTGMQEIGRCHPYLLAR